MTTATSSAKPTTAGPVGAYGLLLRGVPAAAPLLVPASDDWPVVRVTRRQARASEVTDVVATRLDEASCQIVLGDDAAVLIDRATGRVTFVMPGALPEPALVHPYLAPVAATFSWWLGREAVHAGAFARGGRAWAVVSGKEGGKSSTLAWLESDGYPILADDMVVVEAGMAFAGPRCLDLREGAAARFPRAVADAGGRDDRRRLLLGPVPATMPLAGWIFLEWGADVEVRRVPASELLPRLCLHRSLMAPPNDPVALLDLAARPAWELRRPRDWEALPAALERLLDRLDDG